MVQSLAKRAATKGITGDWAGRAAQIVDARIYPALDRQIALIRQLRPTAAKEAGVWRLPDGDALYAAALHQATTTDLSPEQVHQMGLDQVAEISGRIDAILKGEGLTQGTVGERMTRLNDDPAQLYPNTDEGRQALLAHLNAIVKEMYPLLPQAFATLPNAPLEIRRVPVEIQAGAAAGYYNHGAIDGSRPAIYFINLKDTHDRPKFNLPAVTHHEGVPGHHLQISITQESKDIPMLRKIGGFSAYIEGWALYAEGLSDELHTYHTPLERAGYLQSFLFRASRLVVDTGIHSKHWDENKATDYLVASTGIARPRCRAEIERYSATPGQACSYKVGHAVWMRARAKAQAALGAKFDLRRFHEVLRAGAMPLTLLERLIEEQTQAALRA